MSSLEKENITQEELEEQKKQGKQQNLLLFKIGIMLFAAFGGCIMLYFRMRRREGLADGFSKLLQAAQPIIIGLVLAYILNPIMKFLEKPLLVFFEKRCKKKGQSAKLARAFAITGSIIFLLVILTLLIWAVTPALVTSVASLIDTMPKSVSNFIATIQNGRFGKLEVTDRISEFLTNLTDELEKWITTLLPQAQTYIVQFTSGVISVVRGLLNFVIGIIVAVYVLMIKERLIGQMKKMVYAIFKPTAGNIVLETMHKADEIFGGFIIGKIVDSAIIGVICYIGCSILRIPDALLVSVIIGVTNIIPAFGPFIGAVPAVFLVIIQSPWHALYLVIFIIILQQVDGNIIGPKILGSSTGLTSFWVMFAILIGGGMFGFLGMLLGVPVFAMIYYIIRRLVNHSIKKKAMPMETDAYVKISAVDAKTRTFQYFEDEEKEKKARPQKEEKKSKNE